MAEAKLAYLRLDRRERYNTKRAWFAQAWRIVDRAGKDLVQPWCNTRKEARETAHQLGYTLLGMWPEV
jgi:hypothetical protein